MEEKLLNIKTVTEYNDMLGVETFNPLVSVIDLSEAKPMRHLRHTFSFYVIYLKEEKNCDLIYGRRYYDYQKGSVVCLAPGQVIGSEDNGEVFQPKGWALCFDPELIRGTSLGKSIKDYNFFSYEVNEALHLSEQERKIFIECLHLIRQELHHSVDRMSKRLIATNIELLLDYCLRFYDRQFCTRQSMSHDIVARFDSMIADYFENEVTEEDGFPTVKYFANEFNLSPNYFGDLIKKETGIAAQLYIQMKGVEIAKEKLHDPIKTVSQVAYEMGFQYPQHFTRLFKKVTGLSPNEYKVSLKKQKS